MARHGRWGQFCADSTALPWDLVGRHLGRPGTKGNGYALGALGFLGIWGTGVVVESIDAIRMGLASQDWAGAALCAMCIGGTTTTAGVGGT